PPGRIRVITISQNSFADPQTVVDQIVPAPQPPFDVELKKAHVDLNDAWIKRAAKLAPTAVQSDVLGALAYSGLLFDQSRANRKLLLVLSDMRHDTAGIDLETPPRLTTGMLANIRERGLVANLTKVQIWIYSAHTVGKLPSYYNSLTSFWREYFQQAGGQLMD